MKPLLFLLLPLASAITAAAAPPAPQPYGNGTITRDSSGRTAITTRYGNGTITRFTGGNAKPQTWVTSPYGRGSISRGPGGRTLVTTPYGAKPTSGQKISPYRK